MVAVKRSTVWSKSIIPSWAPRTSRPKRPTTLWPALHRGPTRFPLVEKHQLRGDEISQQDRVALARVKSNDRHLHRVDLEEHRLEPVRPLGDRLSYDGGGRGMAQLRLDRRRNEDPPEKTGEQIGLVDQDEVVNRRGVGDDLHRRPSSRTDRRSWAKSSAE